MQFTSLVADWRASVPLSPIPGDPTQPSHTQVPPHKPHQPQPIYDPDPAGPPIELPPDVDEPALSLRPTVLQLVP